MDACKITIQRSRQSKMMIPSHVGYSHRFTMFVQYLDSWLVVDPWEVTRKRIMDYMSVLEHVKEVCFEAFPGQANNITILYMCQASQVIVPDICISAISRVATVLTNAAARILSSSVTFTDPSLEPRIATGWRFWRDHRLPPTRKSETTEGTQS